MKLSCVVCNCVVNFISVCCLHALIQLYNFYRFSVNKDEYITIIKVILITVTSHKINVEHEISFTE